MTAASSILITGAAGAIGSALAQAYAAPGVHLFLGDLAAEPLERLASHCRTLGALAYPAVVDVTHRVEMASWIGRSHELRPLDLVIALAGISKGTYSREETFEEIRAVFTVNLDGLLNTLEPVIPLFRCQGRGQLALMSSFPASGAFPWPPSYCATKAAIRVYGEGLGLPPAPGEYCRFGDHPRLCPVLYDRCQSILHALPGQHRAGRPDYQAGFGSTPGPHPLPLALRGGGISPVSGAALLGGLGYSPEMNRAPLRTG